MIYLLTQIIALFIVAYGLLLIMGGPRHANRLPQWLGRRVSALLQWLAKRAGALLRRSLAALLRLLTAALSAAVRFVFYRPKGRTDRP